MTQIFGDFEEPPFTQEYLILGFSPSSFPLKQRWRNNGLSADFLADYLTTFFPSSERQPNSLEKQAQIKSSISYVANELLENAMKFNDENCPYPISIRLHLESGRVTFLMTNSIAPQAIESFQAYIKQLITSDPNELYINQLEKNAADEECMASGLGLLTMINDYEAKLGWKFETVQKDPEIVALTTMVQVAV